MQSVSKFRIFPGIAIDDASAKRSIPAFFKEMG
jgi:hypothetical protein